MGLSGYFKQVSAFVRERWQLKNHFVSRATISRLQARFPELHQKLKRARKEAAVGVYLEILDFSQHDLGLEDFENLLDLVKNPGPVDPGQLEKIAILRDQHDGIYFDLSEKDDRDTRHAAEEHFKKARFFASIHMYLTRKNNQDLQDAIHEALFACEDPDAMSVRMIHSRRFA